MIIEIHQDFQKLLWFLPLEHAPGLFIKLFN